MMASSQSSSGLWSCLIQMIGVARIFATALQGCTALVGESHRVVWRTEEKSASGKGISASHYSHRNPAGMGIIDTV